MLVSVSLFRLRAAAGSGPPESFAFDTSQPAVGYLGMFSPDQLAAEQSYRMVYVPALRRLPGLERYLIGRVFTRDGHPSRYSHVAVLYWRDRDAWTAATAPGISERLGVPPVGEWVEVLETHTADLAAIPPVAPSRTRGLLSVWLLKLLPTQPPDEGDRYLREVHAPYDRQRPGVRQYWVGPLLSLRSTPPPYSHMALVGYEDWSSLRESDSPSPAPAWIRPMDEWCARVEAFFSEFEEVPRE